MSVLSINASVGDDIAIGKKSVRTGIFKQPLSGSVEIGELGVAGDTIVNTEVHGGEDQAVYLYSAADYAWWSEQLGRPLPPGTFGENLTISDFHPGELRIGDRLTLGDTVVLEITAPRVPCAKFATKMGDPKFVKQFVAAAKPGAYARVITPGAIAAGAKISWQPTLQDFASISEVFQQWHQKSWDEATARKALNSPISKIARRIISERAGLAI